MAIAILVGRNKTEEKQYTWFTNDWKKALSNLNPELDIRIWPNLGNQDEIDLALVWNHPIGIFSQFKNLKGIISLAAGVDHVFADKEFPTDIPLVRVVDPYMAKDIMQYVVACVLPYIKMMPHWHEKQLQKQWYKQPPFTLADKTIGVMGMGHLGSNTAHLLQNMGLKVIGWRNSPTPSKDIQIFSGKDALPAFLKEAHILICMLPLTKETRHILNKHTFAQLPKGSYLINIGRGDHLVEADLLAALANGQLTKATLDVFQQEPLPTDHPFWTHPQIEVTPHIASVTNPFTAAHQVLETCEHLLNGQPLKHQVDVRRGY